jgi:hypothetical protein
MTWRLACLSLLLAVAAPAAAQTPSGPEPTRLTVRPAAPPSPALKYELLPTLADQSPGNAALVYYRAFSPEWWGNIRQPGMWDKLDRAARAPLPQVAHGDLGWVRQSTMLREVDRGARRSYVDWDMTELLRHEGFGLLLPDMQSLREVALLLAVRARLEMAAGEYDKALYTLQTGFALAHHVSDGVTLIQDLVGLAIAHLMLNQLEELIQQPGAPNLYWALTDLPRPFANLRRAMQGEKLGLYGTLPELRDLETTRLTPEQEQKLLPLLGGEGGLDQVLFEGRQSGSANRLLAVGVVLRLYPEAKQALIAEGRPPEQVEALPALQVVLLRSLHYYRRWMDDIVKCNSLPYWEAEPRLRDADRQLRRARASGEGHPFVALVPAVAKVTFAAARADRRIAALRCVEAIRLYAAAHDGKLPAALGDITEVPIPVDPVTGRAFEFRASGDHATLLAPPPPGQQPNENNTVNYELTLRR